MTAVDDARTLSLPEAVTATGTSESTIRRRLREQAFPGAVRDPRGGWRLPVGDLVAAGFTVSGPLVEAPVVEVAEPPEPVEPAPHTAAAEPSRADAARRAKRRRAAQRRQAEIDLRTRAERAEADAARRLDDLAELPVLRRENADLRERVGRAEATAEARGIEVERLLHVVDRLTRAIGAAPDDEPRVVVHDAVTADVVDEQPDVDEPVVEVPDEPMLEASVEPSIDEPSPATARRRWWQFGRR